MKEEVFKEKLKQRAKKIEVELNDNQLELFFRYKNLILEWNEKINLTAIKEDEDFINKHFIDSLTIVKYLKNKENRIIDVGTGGGFPGLPISIYFDKILFTLLDSKMKKINSIGNIINKLGVKNVDLVCDRVENIKCKYDVVLGRGVCCVDKFYTITNHLLNNNGQIIYLNGVNDRVINWKNINVEYFNINEILDIDFYSEKQVVLIKKKKIN